MNEVKLLKIAYEHAKKHSTDPSTQNAAILCEKVNDEYQIVFGYNVAGESFPMIAANCFPSGVVEKPERWERPIKYEYVEHAERNVIYKAASHGVATKGLTMVCPWYACSDCSRGIIQAGIAEVIGHQFSDQHDRAKWYESIARAIEMFEEAGVKYRWVEGEIGVEGLLFSGKLVNR